MANKLDSALALAARGFKVFPIAAGAKFPLVAKPAIMERYGK